MISIYKTVELCKKNQRGIRDLQGRSSEWANVKDTNKPQWWIGKIIGTKHKDMRCRWWWPINVNNSLGEVQIYKEYIRLLKKDYPQTKQ